MPESFTDFLLTRQIRTPSEGELTVQQEQMLFSLLRDLGSKLDAVCEENGLLKAEVLVLKTQVSELSSLIKLLSEDHKKIMAEHGQQIQLLTADINRGKKIMGAVKATVFVVGAYVADHFFDFRHWLQGK